MRTYGLGRVKIKIDKQHLYAIDSQSQTILLEEHNLFENKKEVVEEIKEIASHMNLSLDENDSMRQIEHELELYKRVQKIAAERKKKLEEMANQRLRKEGLPKKVAYNDVSFSLVENDTKKTDYTVKVLSVLIPEEEIMFLSKYFKTSIPFEYVSSLGATLSMKTLRIQKNGQTHMVRIQFWFVSSSDDKWAERQLFLADAHGVLFVFTKNTLQNTKRYCKILTEILEHKTLNIYQSAIFLFKQKKEYKIEQIFKNALKRMHKCYNKKNWTPRTFIVEDNPLCFNQAIIDFVKFLLPS